MKNKKAEKENVPSVTWIAIQPEASTRTSFKSVADYLSETQEDLPMPKRRLCLSPETLNALDNAEKLVENAEKQISQMNFNDLIIDDLEVDNQRFDNKMMEDERIYIRNVVASTLRKGFYDPGPGIVLNKDSLRSKFILTDTAKFTQPSETYKTPRTFRASKDSPKLSHKPATSCAPVHAARNPTTEDCLVCKSSRLESPKDIPPNNTTDEPPEAEKKHDVAEQKINEDKPEKLDVQKGPIISIKGDFFIQTSQIIDIQPNEPIRRISHENVATYEFNHESCERRKETSKSSGTHEEPERDKNARETSISDEKFSGTNLKASGIQSRRPERKRFNKSALSKRKDPVVIQESSTDDNRAVKGKERKTGTGVDNWKVCEDVSIDLDDFSLKEPKILMEMDLLLDHQRKIIRQVHSATEKLDKFLLAKLPVEKSPTFEKSKNAHVGSKRTAKRNNATDDKENRKLSTDYRLVGGSEVASDMFKKSQALIPREFDKGKEITSRTDELPIDTYPTRLVESTSQDSSVDKERFIKAVKNCQEDLVLKSKSPSAETSKDAEYSDNFESVSSVNESVNASSTSDSNKSKSEVANKSLDKESSSSNNNSLVQTSLHTETKSNAGFIENLKSPQSTKENNLNANLHRKTEKSMNEILKSVENIMMDKDSGTNKKQVNNVDIDKHNNDQNSVEIDKSHSVKQSDVEVEIDNIGTKLIQQRKAQFQSNIILNKQETLENHSVKEDIVQHHREEQEKNEDCIKDQENEQKMNGSTEKSQEQLEINSQKTSHLIESISDISFHSNCENVKNSQDSLRLSTLSNNDKHDNVSKTKETLANQCNNEESTESKIEYKLSEVRENLNSLMKMINNSTDSRNHSNTMINDQASDNIPKTSNREPLTPDVQMILANNKVHGQDRSNQDNLKIGDVMLNNTISNHQEHNTFNNRSFVTVLEENSNVVLESFQQHKLSLLKKLESCAIPSHNREKRLFTSTVLGDTEPPNSFARLKGSSESASETQSEGEICLNSSTSYSLGEIRKNMELGKPNSCTQSSVSNSKTSLSHSTGEICGIEVSSSLS